MARIICLANSTRPGGRCIAVFGITDYFSIESYETFQNKIKSVPELTNKRFFPCVELRLDISVNQDSEQIQCHLIFDNENEYDINKINNFLDHLPLKNKKSNGAVAYCTDTDITACGGYDRVSVTKEALEKTLKDSFGNERPFLIIGVASGMGSNRANPNANIKKELSDLFDDFCDLFFGHEGNRDYYLDKNRYENKEVKAKAKPVVATSDGHTFDDCESKLGKKFTVKDQSGNDLERYGFSWIKADPTFKGLLQVLNEPNDRVFVGEIPPKLVRVQNNKTKYMSSISIKRKQNAALTEIWFDNTIPLNPDLVAIIGNKGKGKSAVTDTIGLLCNTKQHGDFTFLSTDNFRQPKDNKAKHFQTTLTWESGTTIPKGLEEPVDERQPELVKYIPQNFLEKICTQLGKVEESDFDRELKKVIFSHVDSAGRLGKASLDELIDYKTSEANEKIQILKQELHRINEEIVALEEKAWPEYCQKLENLRVQKQHELEAHEKLKPVEVPKPDNDPVRQREISVVAAKIETARKELAECETQIALASQKQAEQVQLISIAGKLFARVENLERQVQTFVEESRSDFVHKRSETTKADLDRYA